MAANTTRGERIDKRKKQPSKSALIDQQLIECSVSLEDLEGMSLKDKENLLNLLKTSEKEHDQTENVRSLYEAQEAVMKHSDNVVSSELEVARTAGIPTEEKNDASNQQDTVLPSGSNRIVGDEQSEDDAKHMPSTSANSSNEKKILSKGQDSGSEESNPNRGSVIRERNLRRKKLDKKVKPSGKAKHETTEDSRGRKTRIRPTETPDVVSISSGTEDVDAVDEKKETGLSERVAKKSQRSRNICVMLNESKHVSDKFVSLSSGVASHKRRSQMLENDKNSSESEDPINTEEKRSKTPIRPKTRKINAKGPKDKTKCERTESDTRAGRTRAKKRDPSYTVSSGMEQEDHVLDDVTEIQEDDPHSVDSENPVLKCAVSETEKQKGETILKLEGKGTGPKKKKVPTATLR